MVLFSRALVEEEVRMPPPCTSAKLPVRVLLFTVSEPASQMPPPLTVTEFPENVLLFTVTVLSIELWMPPPYRAEFPANVLLFTVTNPAWL
jgi:hypothetical protein